MSTDTPTDTRADAERRIRDVRARAGAAKTYADEVAVEEYALWTEVHNAGLMSYQDIANVTGWSKQWIRLAITNYRKARAEG